MEKKHLPLIAHLLRAHESKKPFWRFPIVLVNSRVTLTQNRSTFAETVKNPTDSSVFHCNYWGFINACKPFKAQNQVT